MNTTQHQTGSKKFGPPQQPVIARNECYATLRLMQECCENLMAHGDLTSPVFQVVSQFSKNIKKFDLSPTGRDAEAMYALIETGFVPSFVRSPKNVAGAALIRLIELRGTDDSQEEDQS